MAARHRHMPRAGSPRSGTCATSWKRGPMLAHCPWMRQACSTQRSTRRMQQRARARLDGLGGPRDGSSIAIHLAHKAGSGAWGHPLRARRRAGGKQQNNDFQGDSPMMSLRTALAIALAASAPIAFAQDAGTTKRMSIGGGVSQLAPTETAWVGDSQRLKANGGPAPTLGVTYHINDNIGVEAWGVVDKVGHRLAGNGGQGKLGSVDSQPYAISGQYQFRDADATFRPFVGLGYYEQNFSGERTVDGGALGGRRVGIETAKGA